MKTALRGNRGKLGEKAQGASGRKLPPEADVCRAKLFTRSPERRSLKKALTPHEKGVLVQHMIQEHGVSQRQACKALRIPKSSYQYKLKPKNDMPVIQALEEMVAKHSLIGFCQSYFRLRIKGQQWNHKKVYRI